MNWLGTPGRIEGRIESPGEPLPPPPPPPPATQQQWSSNEGATADDDATGVSFSSSSPSESEDEERFAADVEPAQAEGGDGDGDTGVDDGRAARSEAAARIVGPRGAWARKLEDNSAQSDVRAVDDTKAEQAEDEGATDAHVQFQAAVAEKPGARGKWAAKMERDGGGYDVLGKYHITPESQQSIRKGKVRSLTIIFYHCHPSSVVRHPSSLIPHPSPSILIRHPSSASLLLSHDITLTLRNPRRTLPPGLPRARVMVELLLRVKGRHRAVVGGLTMRPVRTSRWSGLTWIHRALGPRRRPRRFRRPSLPGPTAATELGRCDALGRAAPLSRPRARLPATSSGERSVVVLV